MRNESLRPRRGRPVAVLAAACLAVCSVALLPRRAEAGSLVIPAWAFDRGNGRVHADPNQYADAGPLVGSGPRRPWGWTVEYDVDVPVTGEYTLQIRYAAARARPIEVFFDDRNLGKCCLGVTSKKVSGTVSGPEKVPDTFSNNSSGATWEGLHNQWGNLIKLSAAKGKHTVKLTRRGPLPHLVALRLDTPEAFPEEWRPPRYKVRDLEAVPPEYRKAFLPPRGVDVAALRRPMEDAPQTRTAGSLTIPAWTFDRGNARIYASPDQYADAGPLIGSEPQQAGEGLEKGIVEYDVDFPVTGQYTLHVSYAAAEARPVEVFLDGKNLGKCCNGITFGSAPFEQPVRFTSNSSGALKKWEGFCKQGKLLELSITKGKHTVKFARSGPLPHLVALRLDTPTEFPKDWKQPRRRVRDLDSVPAAHRTAVLPPDSVNVGALRLAIEDMTESLGSRYPDGERFLTQLSELEQKQRAAGSGTPEQEQEVKEALVSLRREAMLAHPALEFDKLLFVKRIPYSAHIYEDHCANAVGGNLCLLSPVAPDGKVTRLVPELDGGLFSRFDLSFDASQVVFGYKKKDKPFRIYEIDLDPSTGLTVPGSLRQLTFGGDEEAEAIRRHAWQGRGIQRGFDDLDPYYLPDGKIIFTSSRSMRNVFCFPATVTTLYVMDADGKNMRCLSAGPLTEMGPCLLADGRVVYTRWEYVDKGLGNGQSLWTVRPDGSGVDHLYKNTTIRPAGMLNTRSIPGSQRMVTIGAPHCGREGGPVILIDNRLTRRSPEAMTCITPEIGYPCMYQATWDMGFFQEPYPFSEKFFLVSHSPAAMKRDKAGYGIYVLDAWGNRAELYRDPEISCFQPIPLRPRRKPMQIAPVAGTEEDTAGADATDEERPASLFIQDIYRGMTGIERGRVKYLRVMGALPWPWDQEGIFRVGLNVGVHRKKVYGTAKVHEDGSAHFAVPAEENVFFQALDEDFMALQHMPTFINLMPGEQRSCIGCHEPRRKAPRMAPARPLAMNQPVQMLSPQPGDTGPRMVDYAADVQPVLDRRCLGCHSGRQPQGRLDLTGVPTVDFGRAYENLIGKGLVSYRDCRYGRSHFRPEAPLSFGSHLSMMVERIRHAPCQADLTRQEFIKIVTWIDANVPYYGTYRGKRNLQDKDHPDFRALPLAVTE